MGEEDLLLKGRIPSFEEEGELLGIPLLASGVFWTSLSLVLLGTLSLLVGRAFPGESFLSSPSPLTSTSAPTTRLDVP